MLYDNQEILDYLLYNRGKLIHLYGEADTGRTSVMFSMIDHLAANGKICAYLVPSESKIQEERFRRYIKDPSLCPLVVVKDRKSLSSSLSLLSRVAEDIFIDNFLSYVLYRTRRQNASMMSMLSGYAYGTYANLILCNDTRHIPGEEKTSPAYMEIFRRYSSKNILVQKDDKQDVHYAFKEW